MALYVSSARRLQRTVAVAVVAALAAFLVGWLYGRQQVPSVDNRVAESHTAAADIATGIDRLDIEYQQVLDGADGETVERGVLQPLDELRADLQQAMDRAPWITGTQRSAALDAVLAVAESARAGQTIEQFRATADHASATVRTTFGVDGAQPPG